MKRSRRSRPEGQPGLFTRIGRGLRSLTRAGALARAAGEPGATFERLEERQLLFSLVVDPFDPTFTPGPAPGFGTVTAQFGYVIPLRAPTETINTDAPDLVDFDFDQGTAGPVASGFRFQDDFRPIHNATVIHVIDQQNNIGFLQITLNPGQFVAWNVANGLDDAFPPVPQDPLVNLPGLDDVQSLSSMSFTIGGPDGLDPDATLVELRLRGEVIASFTGAALLAQNPAGTPQGRFTFNAPLGTVFDEVRITNISDNSFSFAFDDIAATVIADNQSPLLEPRIFGAFVVFSGPIGAAAQFLDLYGREIIQTVHLGRYDQQSNALRVDLNNDGVPDYNDGIGRINITGSNNLTSITMWGTTVEGTVTEGFATALPDDILGFFDDFEEAGFGFSATLAALGPPNATFTVAGLPPGSGSLVIGSPFVRDNSSAAAYAPTAPIGIQTFNRADQGIFVQGGNISSVYIHGVVHGSSRFDGFADRFVVGYMVGSLSVHGDLGLFMSATDAGTWVDDDGTPRVSTAGQLVVGRTLGEYAVAGRSLMSITVLGDINTANRPSRDVLRYYESERSANLPLTATITDVINNILGNNAASAFNRTFLPTARADQPLVFGTGLYRNDTIFGAEWIGSIATASEVHGELGLFDPVNTTEDPSDVYAFAVDGTQDVVVRLNLEAAGFATQGFFRLVDSDGRTVAAPQLGESGGRFMVLKYRPNAPGILYLVVQANSDGTVVTNAPYIITVSGMMPAAFGAYHVGAGSGVGVANSVNVLSGGMGSVRVGMGFVDGAGADADPVDIFNPAAGPESDIQVYMELRATTFSITGNLYNITAGADIDGTNLTVGGHFGSLFTGLNPVVGTGFTEGDLRNFRLTVGGSIATMDIRGAVGINNDAPGPPVDLPNSIVIRTGQNLTLRGDIGIVRVGGHMGADTFSVRTPNGSHFAGLLISQDATDAGNNTGIWQYGGLGNGTDIRLGINSDLRFLDVPRVDLNNFENIFIQLVPNVAQTLTDDAGGQLRVQIIGGNANTTGLIRVLPIAGSLGAVVGRIEVNLDGGARLQITGLGNPGSTDVLSVGRIIITNSTAGSSIGIDGNSQVDVWRIDQAGGDEFGEIVNLTPNGDIVAVDMAAMTRLEIRSGDLGQTQMHAWAPRRIGPFLGIDEGDATEVGDVIGVDGGALSPIVGIFRPVNVSINTPGNAFLDDIGSPVDPYLNGLMVRNGDITEVLVGGAVGDVIAADGNIIQVTAHAFGGTTLDPNRFRGIIGTIYADRISNVDVGDGLMQREQSPLSTTGIFANDDILFVTGGRIPGATISSSIMAANVVAGNNAPGAFPTDGIDRVDLTGGGDYIAATIGSANLDAFWASFFGPDDGVVYNGDVNLLSGTGANFLRSALLGRDINTVRLTQGFWDGSSMDAQRNVGRVEAAGYRNSTIGGGELELHLNRMTIGGNLNILTTFGRAGDIQDLTVAVFGRTTEISARDIERLKADSVQGYDRLVTVGSLRSSSIAGGTLVSGTIGNSIRSSEILIAGHLVSLTAANQMTNTRIVVSGPDGRITTLRTRELFTGSITTVGHTDTIEVTEGHFQGSITTFTSLRGVPGNIRLLKAAGDLDFTADIAGTVTEMIAGLNIGNLHRQGVIFVRGDVSNVSAGGQVYSDLRIGGTLNQATIGRVQHKPGASFLSRGSIIAFGRIETVDISGDFAGKIISYSGGIGVVTISDGSLLATGSIEAYDGDLNNVVINRGNLYGNIHADYILFSIRLNGSDDGVFGDIGVNPAFGEGEFYDAFRNRVPPGVTPTAALQGPRITAGHNLGRIILTNGSIFEGFIWAQRAIGTIDVNGNISNDNQTTGFGTVIAAGSSIFLVNATGNISDTMILAGARDFGADARPGGTGADADAVQSGRIFTVTAGGNATNLLVNAGIAPGADGVYNSGDERVTLGISFVREVTAGGAVTNVAVLADSPTLVASPGIVRAGTNFPLEDPDLSNGDPGAGAILLPNGGTLNFNWGGVAGTISFTTDKGQGFWNPTTGQISLINTSLNTELIVNAGATLNNFRIVSNDDASMGLVRVNTSLAGSSVIVIDAYVLAVEVNGTVFNADLRFGANTRAITTGSFLGGSIRAALWNRDLVINGNFGTPDQFGEVRYDALAAGTITVAGTNAGLINIDRDLVSLTSGAMTRAQFRAGNTLGSLTAGSVSESRVSTGDAIGSISVAGNVFDTAFQAGGDLGSDAAPGGSGEAADRVSTGFIGNVTIGGNFERGSVVAGLLRGPDSFFGTPDDAVGPGRSTIGNVTIGGTVVGSNLNTQQYRVSSTGSIGAVTIGSQPPPGTGNFRVEVLTEAQPRPIHVVDMQSLSEALIWRTTLFFNQPMNDSTIAPALTIFEVRDSGNTLIPLVEGVHYAVEEFNPVNNSVAIRFFREVTDRSLPQGADPGPGIYRFNLDATILRASVDSARLDGNGDGFATLDEHLSQDDVVGDAGDKFVPETITIDPGNGPIDIDFYGPADLDLVLDNNYTPDGLPDANSVYTVRGVIGDHPDMDVVGFPSAGDTDIFKITLRAGQILRLGAMQGSARFVGRFLVNDAGAIQGGNSADSLQLPVDPLSVVDDTSPADFLIKRTGTYFIVLTNDITQIDPGIVPVTGGAIGGYHFSMRVFDDGDTGFAGDTDSGNGVNIINAPPVVLFAGNDGVFGTGDDRATIPINDYVFFLDAGPDGQKGTADDVVFGSNGKGISSTRSGGTNLVTTITTAIGPEGHSGFPGEVTADSDVFHLNNGQPIAAGKRITVTVRLNEIGANLGGFSQLTFSDFTGYVQFGLFDVTDATGVDDGLLVFSPTDFKPVAQTPGTIAQRGQVAYGYNADGDFFITFVTPGKLGGAPGEAAEYALYLQGAFNTDYQLTVEQSDTAAAFPIPHGPQNVFIETRGGLIQWLEAGGLDTKVLPFASSVLGFTGTIANLPVDQYILTNLVTSLQSIANAQGLNLNFSTNPAAFEFQNFSTVFLTATSDPRTVLGTLNFGYSEHSDPYNADPNDEAVVFLPSMAILGYTPSQADVDTFIQSLTAAVGRRVGELTGLRITANSSPFDDPIDIMSANSVFNPPTAPAAYAWVDQARPLSNQFDTVVNTNFFLGQQNAFALLSKFLAN
ncbi:MAG: hypothetical protein WD749_12405 [Phycisphaerales bacterium]